MLLLNFRYGDIVITLFLLLDLGNQLLVRHLSFISLKCNSYLLLCVGNRNCFVQFSKANFHLQQNKNWAEYLITSNSFHSDCVSKYINAFFLNVLQSVCRCLVDHKLWNINLSICGACQSNFREFHSVFSVTLLSFCFYQNEKNRTQLSTRELLFLPSN